MLTLLFLLTRVLTTPCRSWLFQKLVLVCWLSCLLINLLSIVFLGVCWWRLLINLVCLLIIWWFLRTLFLYIIFPFNFVFKSLVIFWWTINVIVFLFFNRWFGNIHSWVIVLLIKFLHEVFEWINEIFIKLKFIVVHFLRQMQITLHWACRMKFLWMRRRYKCILLTM